MIKTQNIVPDYNEYVIDKEIGREVNSIGGMWWSKGGPFARIRIGEIYKGKPSNMHNFSNHEI